MNNKNKANKFTVKALNKLFQAVGFKKFDIDFVEKHPADWYKHKTWSIDEEEKYKTWLISAVKKEFKLSKKQAEKESAWFLLAYGWKNKN